MTTYEEKTSLEKRLLKARQWALLGADHALEAFGSVETERKKEGGIVTEVDRFIETMIREKVSQNFPDDSVIGEEFNSTRRSDSSFSWIIDPIDGSAAYSMRLPIWAVCLGIASKDIPDAGVLLAPAVDEEYYGTSNWTRKNGELITDNFISPAEWDDETLLCVTSDAHRRFSIDFPGKCRSLGSSAYHMALVADGRAGGALLGRLHGWDLAAALGFTDQSEYTLKSIDGNNVNWEQLNDAQKCDEPLIFARREAYDELRKRIQERE